MDVRRAMGALLRGLRARARPDLYEIVAGARKSETAAGELRLGVSDDFVWNTIGGEEAVALCDELLAELGLKFRPYRADAQEKELEVALERLKALGGNKFMVK